MREEKRTEVAVVVEKRLKAPYMNQFTGNTVTSVS